MLKATELRIGNIIIKQKLDGLNCGTGEWREYEMTAGDFHRAKTYPEDFKPIPLTKERLEKFGGQKIGEIDFSETGYSFFINGIMIVISEDKILIQSKFSKTGTLVLPRENYKYAHLFQNLIHSLTLQELTLQEYSIK